MWNLGKANVLGVLVNAVDGEAAAHQVVTAAAAPGGRGLLATALTTSALLAARRDPEQVARLNRVDLVTPGDDPLCWALNWLHDAHLTYRVSAAGLTLAVCAEAAEAGLPVYFYGGDTARLARFLTHLRATYPALQIAGAELTTPRRLSKEQGPALARRVRRSGARIVIAGLGSQEQAAQAAELRDLLHLPVIAAGGAGEPGRRSVLGLLTAGRFAALVLLQAAKVWKPEARAAVPAHVLIDRDSRLGR